MKDNTLDFWKIIDEVSPKYGLELCNQWALITALNPSASTRDYQIAFCFGGRSVAKFVPSELSRISVLN